MNHDTSDITYFARTNFRTERKRFGIKQLDRLVHIYCLGKTGTGKTNLLQSFVMQDIAACRGVALFDVHGDMVERVYDEMNGKQKRTCVYLNLPDAALSFGLNPLANVPQERRSFVASGILEVFANLWRSAWGVRLEHILRFTILALLDMEDADFSCITKLLNNRGYQAICFQKITNEDVREFWKNEFPKYSKQDILPVRNKVGALMAHPTIRAFLVENKRKIDLRWIMDNGYTLLVNLSKGHLGSDVSHIIGSLILTSLSQAAFSRVDTPEEDRPPFFVVMDEFHNYTSRNIVEMLSELRKFKVGLLMANQYIGQLSNEIRDGVLGNVGTLISFRVGLADAKHLEKEFYPEFLADDLVNLERFSIYLKLMINGQPSKAFSADTLYYKNVIPHQN